MLTAVVSSQVANSKAKQFTGITNITNPAMPRKLPVIIGDGWDEKKPGVGMMRLMNGSTCNLFSASEIIFSEARFIPLRVVCNEPQVLGCDFPEDVFL